MSLLIRAGVLKRPRQPPERPTYIIDDVVHYCVANMPGAVPLTSSQALNNATLPFVMALANNGLAALEQDPHLANGLNVQAGKIMHPAVIEAPEACLLRKNGRMYLHAMKKNCPVRSKEA